MDPYAPLRLWCPDAKPGPLTWDALMSGDGSIPTEGTVLLNPEIEIDHPDSDPMAVRLLVSNCNRPWLTGIILPVRDPSRCRPLLDALEGNGRVMVALVVERDSDFDRLGFGVRAILANPVEAIDINIAILNAWCDECDHYYHEPEDWGDCPLHGGEPLNVDPSIRLVIAHGQVGPGASICDAAHIDSIVRACRDAGVPCMVPAAGAGEWSFASNLPTGSILQHQSVYRYDGPWVRCGWQNVPRNPDWPQQLPEGW